MSVLVKPLITEKVSELNDKGKYGFVVSVNANKLEIKKEVEKMYQVSVESVNTMNYLGKRKSRFTKSGVISGRKSSFKKAIVQLKAGDIIDFYSEI